MPWELVLDGLRDNESKAAFMPVRRVGVDVRLMPTKSAERLRILIVKGYPGEIPNRIRPDLEAKSVIAAWERLDPILQERIEKPQEMELDQRLLAQRLAEWSPHVLWYCGHGRVAPKPGL